MSVAELGEIAHQLATEGVVIDTLALGECIWRCPWCQQRTYLRLEPDEPPSVALERKPIEHDPTCPIGKAEDLYAFARSISRAQRAERWPTAPTWAKALTDA